MQGDTNGILFIQLNIVVEIAVKLPSEIAQDALKKRVDRAHIEIAVVKQQFIQRHASQFTHLVLVEARLSHEAVKIITLDPILRQTVQLLNDAVFHLVGGLVGKRDGQEDAVSVDNAAVPWTSTRPEAAVLTLCEKQVLDILQCQVIGLTRTCRCPNHEHISIIVDVFLFHGK